jgi:hypothetical protein
VINVPNRPNLTDYEWGYIAGLLDGEGTVDVRRHKKPNGYYHYARLRISNTDKNAIFWLVHKLGGLVVTYKPKIKHYKTVYHYVLENSQNLKYVLIKLIPHLIIKRAKAEELVIFINAMPHRAHEHKHEAAIKNNLIQNIWQSGKINQYKNFEEE